MELPKRYNHQEIEEKWYRHWEEHGYFRADPDRVIRGEKKPFVVMMPPPNVTGIIHMGHVLNNTLQDILCRFRRMQGYEVLYQPGTDHAGIATQNVVEKELAKQGKTRFEVGREKFLEHAWKWKETYEKNILERLKRLGVSADWSKYKFTLDPQMVQAVLKAFVTLYEDGLIYKGLYIINWCPRCGTALADDEVEHKEHTGHLWYIRYPLVDGDGEIVVATTRPETYLGDTAVAVHPDDPRYRKWIGKKVRLPLVTWTRKGTMPDGTEVEVSPEIPIIADPRVDPEFGTGAVKVTPAHDPNDYEIGNEHGLARVIMMTKEAVTNENAGIFQGLDRFVARKKIVEALEKEGYLVKTETHVHAVGHCYRCDTVIEPYLSEEWFVKMKPLAEPAIQAVREGKIRLIPDYANKIYFNWLENVRDWCISRKIWWGHRVPIYECQSCGHLTASIEPVQTCPKCGSDQIQQDPDVLDTWFSSWLWPFSTLGWPYETKELEAFYPTDVLITGWDILFFWVARMIMAGLRFRGEIPFHTVYLHGIVRDEKRRKISKSLGNFVDPLEYIQKYGADGVRMGITLVVPEGQDIIFSEKRIEIGRNFATKIWNAARFLLMNQHLYEPGELTLERLEDQWIWTGLQETIHTVTQGLEDYDFNTTAHRLLQFFWHDFCDWYIEAIKPRLQEGDKMAIRIGFTVLEHLLRLLHPFMPFVTEEIWQKLPNHEGETLMRAPWPTPDTTVFKEAHRRFEFLKEVVREVREARASYRIPPKQELPLYFGKTEPWVQEALPEMLPMLRHLAKISALKENEIPHPATAIVVEGQEFFLPLPGLDLEKERARIQREIEQLQKHLAKVQARLANPDFLERAPAEVIQKEEEKVKTFQEKIAALEAHLKRLR